jgi:hypothetical protein
MNAAPGWYPSQNGQQRYWDGTAWTEHYAPLEEPPPEPFARSNPKWLWQLVVVLFLFGPIVWFVVR